MEQTTPKATIKDYIQLMRPQATFVSVFILIVGVLLGGGSWFTPTLPLFIIYAFIFHWTGFANNEVEDLEYDRRAGKDHKALVKGKIPFRNAMNLVIIGQVLATGVGALIAGTNFWAWFFMLFNIINGILYNMYCKTSYANPIFIANCWMGLGLFGYFSQTWAITPVLILFAVDVWLMFFYDVAYLGYYKDPQDEKNILKALGAKWTLGSKWNGGRHRLDSWFLPTSKTQLWGWTFKLLNMGIAVGLWYYTNPDLEAWPLIGWILACVWLCTITRLITEEQIFDRRKALRNCALSEMATYSVMMVTLGRIIGGPAEVFLIIVIPIWWFIGINRYIWGKGWGLAPNV